ncbi:E3 ubiquitin-protein ligase rnf168-like [Astyanax mexicanus]|uniref:E3 ubiquitin-protein ligase rnf168-like n=1 Tax=Astyanax mexicanus TaxID=7994 RepID=A0A8T2LMM0_ASTMX|nr:E3 ubiquitin-protein ligase rnf168-like [Astyanax mexicanus]
MKSNNSVIQPFTFSNKGEPPNPAYASMKSNNSVIQPFTFSNKGEPPASSGRSGLVQDQSRCGVCEQVLTDPVSITCGHSFCRRCINSFRNRTALSEDFICPCCRKRSTTLPVLHPDIEESINQDSYQLVDDVLQSVLQKHKTSMKNRYKSL